MAVESDAESLTKREAELLDCICDGRGEGQPWGFATNSMLMDGLGWEEHQVRYFSRKLVDRGILSKPEDGLYVFERDPRD